MTWGKARCLAHVLASTALACTPPPGDTEPLVLDTGVFAQVSGNLSGIAQGDDDEPLVGVRITTDPHGYEATTGADGRFQIARLPAATYRLVAALPGYETTEVTGIEVLEGEESTVAVDMPVAAPTVGRVRVVALDPAGLPLAGAVLSDSMGGTGVTGTDGVGYLDDLGGLEVDVSVESADGDLWGRTVRGLSVPPSGVAEVRVQLSGRPAEGAFYMGSDTCVICHSDRADHADTPHGRSLSSTVDGALLDAFEAGWSIDLGAGTSATLLVVGEVPTVRLVDANTSAREYAVAGLLGDARSGSVPFVDLDDQAYVLPVAWRAERDEPGAWVDTEARLVPFQVDTWFRENGTFAFLNSSRPSPALSADARCFPCHVTGFTLTERPDGGVDLTPRFGPGPKWTEGAVGCERCHGPGSTHVQSTPERKPYEITRPDRLDAERANEACGQCHSMTRGQDSELPYPYAAGVGLYHPGQVLADYGASVADLWPSGAAAAPNGQADEMAASAHATGAYAQRCFDCHDPHGETLDDSDEPLPNALRLDARDNTLCASCHLALTFGDDETAMRGHDGHFSYEPTGITQAGRCVRCHMPRVAARLDHSPWTGAGDLASHRFAPLPPQDTLDAFDAVRLEELPVGHFPVHSCAECHEWIASFWENFPGASGDPTRIETHEAFQQGWEAKFP